MKVIGMFFIVWGHTFPHSVENFIYAFNVPVFFVVSGYLYRRDKSWKEMWHKNLYSLIIPYLIICTVKRLGFWIDRGFDQETLLSVFGTLAGFHSIGETPCCTMLWFVATLFFIKCIFQLCITGKRSIACAFVVSLILAVAYTHYSPYFHNDLTWGLTNVPLAMPFFLLGYVCSHQYAQSFNAFCERIEQVRLPLVSLCAAILFVLVYWLSKDNVERLNMFKGVYSGGIVETCLSGVFGTVAILLCSLKLNRVSMRGIYLLSIGTLLILGFHRDIANPLEEPFEHFASGTLAYDGGMCVVSIVVMLLFIPIIHLVKKYVPILLGGRK